MTTSTASLWHDSVTPRPAQKRTGLKVLFLAIGSFFFLFIVAYMTRSEFGDYQHLTAPWEPLARPVQLWINTGLLICASLALQWARTAAPSNRRRSLEGLLIGGVCTVGFIAGQMAVWVALRSQGYFFSDNPAFSFFYLLTGLHAIHMLGGMIAWLLAVARNLRDSGSDSSRSSIELCAIYWHFLLLIWLILFALLASSPETFEALAAFCGLR